MSFRGDSQLRTLFNYLMSVYVGVDDAATKGVEGPSCVDSLRPDSPHADAASFPRILPRFFSCFSSDPLGEEPSDFTSGGNLVEPPPSVLVLNFGQHHAALRRATVSDYSSAFAAHTGPAFRAAAAARAELPAREPAEEFSGVVWLETPSLPPRDDEGVRGHGDWRTPSRIRLYNAAVALALAPSGELARARLPGGRPLVAAVAVADVVDGVIEGAHDAAHLNADGSGGAALDVLCARLVEALCGDSA
jgi:hypothetical protein